MTDYEALVNEAREYAKGGSFAALRFGRLANAVEALVAERAETAMHVRDAQRHYDDLRAERDALRAQLDGMTVETRRLRYPDKGRLMTTDAPVITEHRMVSPWTAVEEGDDQ